MGKASGRKRERRELMGKVTLMISMDEKGRIGVNGPIQDKIFCLGLLELAKVVVLEYNPDTKVATPMGPRVVEQVKKAAN
jgi:hypothetical protein